MYRGENKIEVYIVACTLVVVRNIIVPIVTCECDVPRQMLTLYPSRALNAEYKSAGVQQLFTAVFKSGDCITRCKLCKYVVRASPLSSTSSFTFFIVKIFIEQDSSSLILHS